MTESSDFRLWDLPMARDRSAGWRVVSEHGEVFQDREGNWLLTSREAVRFAHLNPKIFSSAGAFQAAGIPVPFIPVGVDPPDHRKYRRILDPMFAPRVIDSMDAELRGQVRELVAGFAGDGECDLVAQLARLYPTQVFLTLFGLPLAERDRLIGWVETMNENSTTGTADPSPETARAATELFSFLQHHIREKRANPSDDVLGRILALEGEEAWSDEEVLGLSVVFTTAGLDTVTAAIGFTLWILARSPELRRRVVADPALVGPLIEESLRVEPPVATVPRITTEDVEVCGVPIPAGSPVMICMATANRDPERYDHPDEIDLDQSDRGQLTFGGGVHRCLGSHLARRELRLVIEEFHRRRSRSTTLPPADPGVRTGGRLRARDRLALGHPAPALAAPGLPAGERVVKRLVIDLELCTGNGRCYSLFPELFTDDESGYGRIVGDGVLGEDSSDAGERAVLACPEQAIRIEEE